MMGSLARLLATERIKLRRMPLLHFTWVLPLLFLLAVLLVFERPVLGLRSYSDAFLESYRVMPLKLVVALWGGFVHPLVLAVSAGLIFRPEHRHRMWRHIQVQPIPRWGMFLSKALWVLLLQAVSLILIGCGLWGLRLVTGWLYPFLDPPFPTWELARTLGWLWLGGVPVTAFYLWLSDRMSTVAVPVVFGLVGLLLTIALGATEHPKPWRRDSIPFVTPYFAAQKVLMEATGAQESHAASRMFQDEPDILRLPSGRRVRTRQSVPDHVLFPPPPPTSWRGFLQISLGGALGFLLLGLWDSQRNRA